MEVQVCKANHQVILQVGLFENAEETSSEGSPSLQIPETALFKTSTESGNKFTVVLKERDSIFADGSKALVFYACIACIGL